MKIIQAFACFVLPILIMMVWSPSAYEKRNSSYGLIWVGMNCIVFGGIMGKAIPVHRGLLSKRSPYISGLEACLIGGFFIVVGIFVFASDPS